MGITGSNGHLSQLIGQADNRAVDIAQSFFILYQTFPHEELVVCQGLDFQVIIIGSYFQQFFIRQLFLHHGTDQFPCFTGRPQDEPFPVFIEHRPGNTGPATVNIFQMGNADQLV